MRLMAVVPAPLAGRRAVAIVLSVRVFLVEIAMHIAQRAMIRFVVATAIEPIGVGLSMVLIHLIVETAMLLVILGMLAGMAAVPIVTLGQGTARRDGERKERRREQYFPKHKDLHGGGADRPLPEQSGSPRLNRA